MPVLLLSDGSLAFSTQSVPYPNPDAYVENRKRWDARRQASHYAAFTAGSISPMCGPCYIGLHRDGREPVAAPDHALFPGDLDAVDDLAESGTLCWPRTDRTGRLSRFSREPLALRSLLRIMSSWWRRVPICTPSVASVVGRYRSG